MEDDENSTMSESPGTPVTQRKKGRKRLVPIVVTTPAPIVTPTTSNVIVSNANNSPKNRFPNNPMLKKKLLGLQKFLSDYTV